MQNCGETYNIADVKKTINGIEYIFPPLPPKREGVCDKCRGPLIKREDDKPEVIRHRLRVYKRISQPVISYYRAKGTPFIEICVNREPSEIVARIINHLKRLRLI